MPESKPKPRILYVADDSGVTPLLQKRLEQAGYVVDAAPDGQTGLRMAAAHSYEAVLVGYAMPGMNGLDFIQALKEQGGPPVLILTGSGSEDIAVQAMKLGACDYVMKDVDGGYFDLLVPVIERIVDQEQRDQAVRRREQDNRLLFEKLLNGFALHEIILNADGVPCDYRFLDVNPAFEEMTGLKRDEIIGRTALQVLPRTEEFWIQTYGQVALTGEPVHLEEYSVELDKYFEVRAYSPRLGHFAAVFTDVTDRNRAEARHEEQRRMLWTLLDTLPELVVFKDRDGVYRVGNQWHADFHGIDVKSLAGKTDFDMWPTDQADAFRQEDLAVVETGKTLHTEHRLDTPEGEVRWAEVVKTPMRNAEGAVVGILCSERDITDRKCAEEAARRHSEVEAALADLSSALLSPVSREETASLVLERAGLLTGSAFGYAGYIDPQTGYLLIADMTRTAQDACALGEKGLVLKEFRGLWGWVLNNRQSLISNNPAEDERSFTAPGGHIAIDRFICAPALIGDTLVGQIGLANSGRDYTDEDRLLLERLATLYALALQRQRSEEALRESERKFRSLFNAAQDTLFITDLKGRFLEFNDAACTHVGYSRDQMLDIRISDIIEPGNAERVRRRIQSVLEKGHIVFETTHVRSDSSTIPVEVHACAFEYDGSPAVLSIVRDLSERKRLQQQIIESQRMETVGRLAGGIAHQFNNLLTVLGGYAHFVRESLEPGDLARDDIDQVIKASERLAELTRHMLAFARRQVIRPRELSLNGLLYGMDRMLEHLLGPDIRQIFQLLPDLWTVEADPIQLEQVLVNLAINAREAMPNGGTLTIGTSHVIVSEAGPSRGPGIIPGDYVLLTVEDTGIGMDEETLSRVFEPFFTTRNMAEAVGMGLPAAYGIVKQHGGDILVQSIPGRGSRFDIYFPRFRAEAPN